AAPLVALWFGQINGWSVVSGLLAMPLVATGMLAAALQLLAEACAVGAWLSPVTAFVGKWMIAGITWMAHWPGASMPVRPLSPWMVLLLYAALLVWAGRRRWGLSRAAVFNLMLGTVVVSAGWYFWTGAARQAHGEIEVLDAGTSSAI